MFSNVLPLLSLLNFLMQTAWQKYAFCAGKNHHVKSIGLLVYLLAMNGIFKNLNFSY